MFEVMDESSGRFLGIRAIGVIQRSDYDELVPICRKLISEEGSMSMLVDMEDFKLEAPSAWRADFKFGQELRNSVERMAIVGDRWWETWMVDFCRHFYAREAKYFHTSDMAAAWDWVKEEKEQAA